METTSKQQDVALQNILHIRFGKNNFWAHCWRHYGFGHVLHLILAVSVCQVEVTLRWQDWMIHFPPQKRLPCLHTSSSNLGLNMLHSSVREVIFPTTEELASHWVTQGVELLTLSTQLVCQMGKEKQLRFLASFTLYLLWFCFNAFRYNSVMYVHSYSMHCWFQA